MEYKQLFEEDKEELVLLNVCGGGDDGRKGYRQYFLITSFYYNWLLIILKHTPPSSPPTSDSNLVPSLRPSPSPEFSRPSSFCFLLFCFVSFHMCGAAVAGWSRLLLVSISSAWPMSALPADLYALDLPSYSSSSSDSTPGDLLCSAALWRAGFFVFIVATVSRWHCCDLSYRAARVVVLLPNATSWLH